MQCSQQKAKVVEMFSMALLAVLSKFMLLLMEQITMPREQALKFQVQQMKEKRLNTPLLK